MKKCALIKPNNIFQAIQFSCSFIVFTVRTYCSRVEAKLEQLPCEQFIQAFEISRSILRAKQVEEEREKIQKPVKIAHMAAVLFFLSL